jgi:hypothetical protein
MWMCSCAWGAHCHSKSWREGFDGLLLYIVLRQVELSVIDCKSTHSAVLTWTYIHRRHTVVGSVCRILEVQDSSPVIGKVLRHLARGARGALANITFHCSIEGVSTDDVVKMSGWAGAWLAGRIKALKGQRRAWEAKASLNNRDER